MALISDLWQKVEVYCEHDNAKLELTQVRKEFCYQCPVCKNYIKVSEYEKILDKICQLDNERRKEKAEYSIENENFRIGKNKHTIRKESENYDKWEVNSKIC